jgi:hypothetical protein
MNEPSNEEEIDRLLRSLMKERDEIASQVPELDAPQIDRILAEALGKPISPPRASIWERLVAHWADWRVKLALLSGATAAMAALFLLLSFLYPRKVHNAWAGNQHMAMLCSETPAARGGTEAPSVGSSESMAETPRDFAIDFNLEEHSIKLQWPNWATLRGVLAQEPVAGRGTFDVKASGTNAHGGKISFDGELLILPLETEPSKTGANAIRNVKVQGDLMLDGSRTIFITATNKTE